MRRLLLPLLLLLCAWTHGGPVSQNFLNDGASMPWYNTASSPAAFHVTSTNTDWYFWEGWKDVGGTKQRVVNVATKNFTTGLWTPTVTIATNTIPNDIHGVPVGVRDSAGYVYVFYGSHSTALKIASTTTPDNPSSWRLLSDLAGNHTFENPSLIGSSIYLVDSGAGSGSGTQAAVTVTPATFSSGVLSWGTATKLVDVTSGGDGWAPISYTAIVGTKIHIVFPYGTTIGSMLQNAYYVIYDTVTGGISNYSGSLTATSGQLPISLTTLNTNFVAYSSSSMSFQGLAIDSNGASHVVFCTGVQGVDQPPLRHITANGGAWSSPTTIYTYPSTVNSINCNPGVVANTSGGIDVYYGDASAAYTYPAVTGILTSGNMLKSTRSSAGVWTGPSTVLSMTSQGLDNPEPVANSAAGARVVFTEVTFDFTTVSGILRGYSYGDYGFNVRGLPNAVATTLSSSNTSPGATLSNGNLTAIANTENVSGQVSRANGTSTGGAYYAEFPIDFRPGLDVYVGLINATQAVTGKFLGDTGNNSIGWYRNAAVYLNGAVLGTVNATLTQGSTASMAWNDTLKKVWFRKDCGNWNNDVIANQNPATGVGGFSYSAVTGQVYPAVEVDNIGDQITANLGATGNFKCSVPATYSNYR